MALNDGTLTCSPLAGSVAAATVDEPGGVTGRGQLAVTWEVQTDRPLLALTFDDGPGPNWTPMVLDILEAHRAPATFFMVGSRVRRHGRLLRGRIDRHEIGNHTWDHADLGRCGAAEARSELRRAHEAIIDATGRVPRLFRPPFGHLSGSALIAASELGYQVVLWSRKMHEAKYPNTAKQAEAMIRATRPGNIVLAHDVGHHDRLVSIRGLPAMITGLRARGYEFVTVTDLLASQRGVSDGHSRVVTRDGLHQDPGP